MGLFAIADYAYRQGYRVGILHLGIEKIINSKFSLEGYLKETNPKIIGLSLHWHHQSYDVIEIAKLIKKAKPECFIILGGLTASYFHREIIQSFSFIDGVIRGDGEVPFIVLLSKRLRNKETNLFDIPNLTWRKDGEVISNNISYIADSQDLDKLNFTNLKLLKNHELYVKYANNPFIWLNNFNAKVNKLILDRYTCFPLCITRGCDMNCSFCGGSRISNLQICKRDGLTFRSVENVVSSVKELKTYGYDSIHVDFSPVNNSVYFKKLFDEIKSQQIKVGCIAAFRALPSRDLIEKLIATFEKPKSKILFSPESASEEARKLNKGHYFSNEQLLDTIKFCSDLKINTEVFFVSNLPFQSYDDISIIKNFHINFKKNFSNIRIYMGFLELEPASPMYLYPEKYNIASKRTSFLDFYYAQSGKDNSLFSSLGYCQKNSFTKNEIESNRGKNRIFEEKIQNIYCKDYCKLSRFITHNYLFRIQNKFVVEAISIFARFLCKMLKNYHKIKEEILLSRING